MKWKIIKETRIEKIGFLTIDNKKFKICVGKYYQPKEIDEYNYVNKYIIEIFDTNLKYYRNANEMDKIKVLSQIDKKACKILKKLTIENLKNAIKWNKEKIKKEHESIKDDYIMLEKTENTLKELEKKVSK